MRKKNIGSDFDDFLNEEGILAEAQETAIKRVLSYQLEKAMLEKHISKAAMARKMNTSRSSLDRLLNPNNDSVTLQTMQKAAFVLGRRLKIELA
jgi:DNA-binding Xre family transcriptional regulator